MNQPPEPWDLFAPRDRASVPRAASDSPSPRAEPPREAHAREVISNEAPSGARIYSVSALTREIRGRLEGFGRVSVEGEVTRVTTAASGHLYFDLKDIDAKIACTVWKSQTASALRFELAEGQQVVAHGKLDVYAPRGTYSLNVQRLEKAGIGALLQKLEELKRRLAGEGWFDRHRPVPKFPRRIGVVTSRDGAAFQDFLRTRSLRWPLYPLLLAHTSVQGAAAAREIAAAIDRLAGTDVEVIVVCRGGGSIEDLWAFNELPVLEAIRRASVPVVSGVGHQTDTTLCDLVSDHRAHTPTDAAQTVLPDRALLTTDLERLTGWLARGIDAAVAARAERLERSAAARVLCDPRSIVAQREERVNGLARRLAGAIFARRDATRARLEQGATRLLRQRPDVRLERARSGLESLRARLDSAGYRAVEVRGRRLEPLARGLESISPFAVLARGYSITTRRSDGKPLTSADGVATGEVLETRLASGSVVSAVTGIVAERT